MNESLPTFIGQALLRDVHWILFRANQPLGNRWHKDCPRPTNPLCGHPLLCWAVVGLPGSRTHSLTWPLHCRVLAAGLHHTHLVLVGKGQGRREDGHHSWWRTRPTPLCSTV